MIVETAFWGLPLLLARSGHNEYVLERNVVDHFRDALREQLRLRGASQLYERVTTEALYDTKRPDGQRIHADLLVRLDGSVLADSMKWYGAREYNWIEVKELPRGLVNRGASNSTTNAGEIVRDLIRLCVLPKELESQTRRNARYLLLVFSASPESALAMRRRTQGGKLHKRTWLYRLLREGYASSMIDLSSECKTLLEAVGKGFSHGADLRLRLGLRSMAFRPDYEHPSTAYWGCLARIQYFQIEVSDITAEYRDEPGRWWGSSQQEQLEYVRQKILGCMFS